MIELTLIDKIAIGAFFIFLIIWFLKGMKDNTERLWRNYPDLYEKPKWIKEKKSDLIESKGGKKR